MNLIVILAAFFGIASAGPLMASKEISAYKLVERQAVSSPLRARGGAGRH